MMMLVGKVADAPKDALVAPIEAVVAGWLVVCNDVAPPWACEDIGLDKGAVTAVDVIVDAEPPPP
jgi:hypothetical protein